MTGDWSAPGHERDARAPSSYSSYAPAPYPDYGAAPTPGQPGDAAYPPPGAPPGGNPGAPGTIGATAQPSSPAEPDPFALPPHLAAAALAGPGYQSPRLRNSPWAIVTIVLALVLFFVPWASIAVIALAHLTLHLLKDSYDGGRGLTLAALALGYLSVVGWTALYLL